MYLLATYLEAMNFQADVVERISTLQFDCDEIVIGNCTKFVVDVVHLFNVANSVEDGQQQLWLNNKSAHDD